MSGDPHILILGAGLVGLSTADALVRRNLRVSVMDPRPAVMGGASFANSGMIHPSQACNWAGDANAVSVDRSVRALAERSLTLLQDRMAELGLDAMRRRAPGCVQLFDTDADAHEALARMTARGIVVDRVEPSPRTFDRPALVFPGDRSGNAWLYGQSLAHSLKGRGVAFHLSAQTPTLRQTRAGAVVLQAGPVTYQADHIIIACGAQTPDLLASLGLSVPIRPMTGWAVDYARPDDLFVPDRPVMDAPSRSALSVFDDRLRLSGTWGEPSADPLLARWRVIAPDVMAVLDAPIQIWSGQRPVCDWGRPIIGPTPRPGLWINAGHGHMGWTLCAASGALMADMICDGRTDPDFAGFDHPLAD